MTEAKTGAKATAKNAKTVTIHFRCQWCQQERPLEEMTSLTRFSPVIIVCRRCARKIH
jgi:ribosomal protein L44E